MNRIHTDFDLSVKLEWMGHHVTDPWWVQSEHRHDFFELLYVLKGNLTVTTDQNEVSVSQGKMLILPPKTSHQVTATTHTSFLCLGFRWRVADIVRYTLIPLEKSKTQEILDFSDCLDQVLEQVFEEKTDFSHYGAQVVSKLTVALCSLGEEVQQDDPKVILSDKVKEYVGRHIGEPIRVEELAATFYCIPHGLGTAFASVNGMTVKEYVLQQKMEKAVMLMGKGKQSVAEIARKLGYDSPNYFSKCFKAYYGFPPKKLRSKDESK